MSDEEEDDEIFSDDEEFEEQYWNKSKPKIELSKSGQNVGKSLRGIADSVGGKVMSKDQLFQKSGQMPLGIREKYNNLDDIDSIDESERNPVRMELEEEEDDDISLDLMKDQSSNINPQHVLNQRKTEAEIIGTRIRLQTLAKYSEKFDRIGKDWNKREEIVENLKGIVQNLNESRNVLIENGSMKIPKVNTSNIDDQMNKTSDEVWEEMLRLQELIWEEGRKAIETWERRTHLSIGKGKTLRAVNKSIFEQTTASLNRRNEIGKNGNFFEEDSSFYQQLLRDFVAGKSKDSIQRKQEMARKKSRYGKNKDSKESRLNHQVHEKLVDFAASESFPAPSIDVDQLIKSLFQ